ncbi:unnamed protein product, partial [Adineta steineri]
HNRDRNRIDSPSHKRTQSHDPSKPLHHTNSEMGGRPSSIHEDDIENGTTRTSNTNIRFPSQDPSMFDDHQSITTNTPNEITSAPAVDLELNVQIQIASGSCNLYTSRDLISNSTFTTVNPTKQQQSQVNIGSSVFINKVEYQVSQFFLPGVDVDAHYNSKHNNTMNSALNKRASFYCRAMIQSPTTQITIHPLLLDFLEQTLEHVTLPQEQDRQTNLQQEQMQNSNEQTSDNDHLKTMFLIEDQSSTTSFPIDVVVSLFIQPSVLLFTCLPTHPMECELRLPTVDVVFSSKRALLDNIPSSSTTNVNESEQILENSLGGLSFSLYMKDFHLNVYHPFSGESKVHLFEDIRSGQLRTRNALAVSVQSVSFNISRTRYTLIERDGEFLNNIQLSIIGQISKAQFEYDIKRFSEILTFPKIWYNRSLARRLFLGDETIPTTMASSSSQSSTSSTTSNTFARPIAPTIIKTTTNKQLRKEARVLLAIQLKELQVSMRMSNVMGKVEWNTTDVCSTASLTLTNDGQRALFFSVGLQKSVFQADEGIVGGIIRLKNLRTTGLIRHALHDPALLNESCHTFDVLADAIEIRLDYMSFPTLMGRISHILLRLKDDHHGTPGNVLTPSSTLVFVNMEWSQLHLMITRSTTPDIIKMIMKLCEFFNAHLHNSKSLLASIHSDFHDGIKRNNVEKKTTTGQSKYDTNIIKRYIGMHGGELMLQGHNLTLVVFHGSNFKARQWALFSLNEPQINFVTDRGENDDINQKLFFYLGHQGQTIPATPKSRTNMASISKVIRNSNEAPPSHLTINEWFNYASSTISAVGLRDFPTMDDVPIPTPPTKVRSKQYEQNAESIFILPALELRFQTRQLSGQVHCSFETEFYEHIMFSFNAEHFYFLHDLISSYMKEKEKATAHDKPRSRATAAGSHLPPLPSTATTNDNPTLTSFDEVRSDDIRCYHCPDAKWKLQPTIKLLTAYGNEVEPFGADYILQKLGFRHARLTIPKWLQRGIMDPCEQSMTVVQLFLIFLLPERFKEICMRQ